MRAARHILETETAACVLVHPGSLGGSYETCHDYRGDWKGYARAQRALICSQFEQFPGRKLVVLGTDLDDEIEHYGSISRAVAAAELKFSATPDDHALRQAAQEILAALPGVTFILVTGAWCDKPDGCAWVIFDELRKCAEGVKVVLDPEGARESDVDFLDEGERGGFRKRMTGHAGTDPWIQGHKNNNYSYTFRHKDDPRLLLVLYPVENHAPYNWSGELTLATGERAPDNTWVFKRQAAFQLDAPNVTEAVCKATKMLEYHLTRHFKELGEGNETTKFKQHLAAVTTPVGWNVYWWHRDGHRKVKRVSVVTAVSQEGAIEAVCGYWPRVEVHPERVTRNPAHDSMEAFKAHLDRLTGRIGEASPAQRMISKLSPVKWVLGSMSGGLLYFDDANDNRAFYLYGRESNSPPAGLLRKYMINYCVVVRPTAGANLADVGQEEFEAVDYNEAAVKAKEMATAFFHRREMQGRE